MKMKNKYKRLRSITSRKSITAHRALIEACEPRVLMSATYTVSKIADFTTATGFTPIGDLIMDSSGNLYGANNSSGANGDGDVFKVNATTHVISTVASFGSTTGFSPVCHLVMDSSGNLYGTTEGGGANSAGTVFKIVANSGVITTIASFNSSTTGQDPLGGLAIDSSGNLYGTTASGGANAAGTIFKVTSNGTLTTLASFNTANGNGAIGAVVLDASGNLYGTTQAGGANHNGTVFEVAAGSGAITDLHDFSASTGQQPLAGLIIDSSGNLYGTANSGGASSDGTIFTLAAGTHTFSVLASLGSTTGANPEGNLVEDSNGDLFGTTNNGGANALGTAFELAAGSNTITPLASFSSTTGYNIRSAMVFDPSGNLYGAALSGGTNSIGTVFEITHSSATQTAITSQPTAVTAGVSQSISVSLEDVNGVVDATNQSNVTLAIATDPNGATVGGTLTVAAVNGVATFSNLTFNKSGAYTLTASSSGLTSATTAPVTSSSAAAAAVVFVQQPTASIAGQSIGTVVADVQDAFGNLITTGTSSVTVSSNTGLFGTLMMQAVGGVATFTNLSDEKTGARLLSATDGSLAAAQSNSFSITPASAAQLAFAQLPATATTAGQNIGTVEVDVEDAFGNLVSTDTSAVTVSTDSTLGGTPTVQAVSGVATFSDLSLTLAGTHVLTATDTSLSPQASNSFTITPAAASQLVFVQQPTSAEQGLATSTIIVDIEDAFGNVVTTDTSTITLATIDGASLGGTTSVQASAGAAVFSNLSIETLGAHSLLANDGSLASATSNSITVTPPIPLTITVQAFAQPISATSPTDTLHVQADQSGGDSNLIYTWAIISQPIVPVVTSKIRPQLVTAAPLAVFSVNGTHTASDTAVTFQATGDYTFQVTASNGTESVSSDVQVAATVKAPVEQTALVSGVQTVGDASTITGFVVTFNQAMDPTTAQDIQGYRILRQFTVNDRWSFWQNPFSGNRTHTETAAYHLSSAVYDSQTDSVALTLTTPMLVKNGFRLVQVLGVGPHAVTSATGEIINGDSNATPGGNFTYRFRMQVAKTIVYSTLNGDEVRLSLSGPGQIVSLLPTATDTPVIFLRDTDLADSILTGSIRKGRKSLGYVVLDQLNDTSTATIDLGAEFHVNTLSV